MEVPSWEESCVDWMTGNGGSSSAGRSYWLSSEVGCAGGDDGWEGYGWEAGTWISGSIAASFRLRESEDCCSDDVRAEGVLCTGGDFAFAKGVDSSSGWRSFRLSSLWLSSACCWCCAETIASKLGCLGFRLKPARMVDSRRKGSVAAAGCGSLAFAAASRISLAAGFGVPFSVSRTGDLGLGSTSCVPGTMFEGANAACSFSAFSFASAAFLLASKAAIALA